MKSLFFKRLVLISIAISFATCAYAGWDPRDDETADKEAVNDGEVAEAIANFKKSDSGLKVFFENAHGYAIFPTVGKGGFGIGGAYGKGEVYEKGKLIGYTSLKQLTIGFQLGGQAYSEIIFFKDKKALDDFTSGNFEFSAQASAVAVKEGVSADTDYDDGVAVFTVAKGGLMFEASIGGQKFKFKPLKK